MDRRGWSSGSRGPPVAIRPADPVLICSRGGFAKTPRAGGLICRHRPGILACWSPALPGGHYWRWRVRVLVTGGAGFIGSNLCRRLVADGHSVTAQDDFSSADWRNLIDVNCDVLTCDLAGDTKALEVLEPFEIILHQASITDTTVHEPRRMMSNNVEAFRNILDLAADWRSRVVWASSASIYGNNPAPNRESQKPAPLNVYAFSKLAMERLAERYRDKLKHPLVGLRYFNVYGQGEDHKGKFASMIHQLARQMRAGNRPRIFASGQQRRDFVYVDDVVQANLKAMAARVSGVFNVGSGKPFSFNEVVAALNGVLGTSLPPDYFENPYSFTQDHTEADLSESRKALGYEPQHDPPHGIDTYYRTGQLGVSR
jgi:ADP-L-glycero-D-manno-heptose 6-epimerase